MARYSVPALNGLFLALVAGQWCGGYPFGVCRWVTGLGFGELVLTLNHRSYLLRTPIAEQVVKCDGGEVDCGV